VTDSGVFQHEISESDSHIGHRLGPYYPPLQMLCVKLNPSGGHHRQSSIEDRYEDAQAAMVAREELQYAQFSTLETIVTSVEACWRSCGSSTSVPLQQKGSQAPDTEASSAYCNALSRQEKMRH
jgi:hypothetical protein